MIRKTKNNYNKFPKNKAFKFLSYFCEILNDSIYAEFANYLASTFYISDGGPFVINTFKDYRVKLFNTPYQSITIWGGYINSNTVNRDVVPFQEWCISYPSIEGNRYKMVKIAIHEPSKTIYYRMNLDERTLVFSNQG